MTDEKSKEKKLTVAIASRDAPLKERKKQPVDENKDQTIQ